MNDLATIDFNDILEDGVTGNEPIFNVALMTEATKAELAKLEALPAFNLSTEQGRKSLNAAVKPIKQIFADFEKNIKVVKKIFSEIPKKCDAVSKTVRDLAEPALDRVKAPLKALDEQEKLVQKWWNKEGLPTSLEAAEAAIAELSECEPLPHSTEAEKADYAKHLTAYVNECRRLLDTFKAAKEVEALKEQQRLKELAEAKAKAEEEAAEAAKAKAEAMAATQAAQAAQAALEAAQNFQNANLQNANSLEAQELRKATRRAAAKELQNSIENFMERLDVENLNVSDTRFFSETFVKEVFANKKSAWAFNYGGLL